MKLEFNFLKKVTVICSFKHFIILICYYLNSPIFRSSSNILILMINISFFPQLGDSPFLLHFVSSFIISLVIIEQIEEKWNLWVLNTSFSHVVLLLFHSLFFFFFHSMLCETIRMLPAT